MNKKDKHSRKPSPLETIGGVNVSKIILHKFSSIAVHVLVWFLSIFAMTTTFTGALSIVGGIFLWTNGDVVILGGQQLVALGVVMVAAGVLLRMLYKKARAWVDTAMPL